MPAKSPEEICSLFQGHVAEGDIEAVLNLYDPDAVFLNEAAEVTSGRQELREEIAPLVSAKARFEFDVRQVIQADNIALMHTRWNVSGPRAMSVHAIEIARRQPDGTWCWLIGDPFTVGRESAR